MGTTTKNYKRVYTYVKVNVQKESEHARLAKIKSMSDRERDLFYRSHRIPKVIYTAVD